MLYLLVGQLVLLLAGMIALATALRRRAPSSPALLSPTSEGPMRDRFQQGGYRLFLIGTVLLAVAGIPATVYWGWRLFA